MGRRLCAIGAFLLGVFSFAVTASPILSGSVELVSAPPSVLLGAYESSTARLFSEGVFTVSTDTTVNIINPGTYDYPPGTAVLGPGTYQSWLVVSDPPGETLTFVIGSIVFDKIVLAVIGTDAELNSSLASFGHPGTVYATDTPHGMDFGPSLGADRVTLSSDRLTVSFDWATWPHQDELRILTEYENPEPASVFTLVGGLALIGFARRLRR